MNWTGCIFMLAALEILEITLYVAFNKYRSEHGVILFFSLVFITIVLMSGYIYLKSIVFKMREVFIVRMFIYKSFLVAITSTFSFFSLPNQLSFLAYFTLCFTIYMIRVFFYMYIKSNFKKHMLGGMSKEIIWLEKYILLSKGLSKKDVEQIYTPTFENFYRFGYPEALNTERLFSIWNNKAKFVYLRDVSEPCNFVVEMEDSGAFSDEPKEQEDGEGNYKEGHIQNSSMNAYYDYRRSSSESESAEIKKVTSSSLQKFFSAEDAKEVFRIISYDRSSELDYKMFKENIRQINAERTNLYKSIDDFYSLMLKVKMGSILLQTVSFISLLFLFLDTGSFITMLCLPFFLFLLLPSLERISSSIFFILMSNPFNSGDRLFLCGENLLARKITLLSTKCDKWNGEKIVVSNEKIAKSTVLNLMRSISQQWRLELVVLSSIPKKKIEELRGLLKRFVSKDKAFLAVSLNSSELLDSRFLKLLILVKHKKNYQNGFFMWTNHNKFMRELIASMQKLQIRYYPMEEMFKVENMQSFLQ